MPNPICNRRNQAVLNDPVPPLVFRTFDGVNDDLQSASNVDLSGVNKITVALWLWWDTFANDNKLALELTANASTAGSKGFFLNPNSSSTFFDVRIQGDIGNSSRRFTRPSAAAWHHYAVLLDMSKSTNEVDAVYVDGVSQSLTTLSDLDNTANFASDKLNVMSRNNASLFGAGRMARLTIWPGVILSAAEVGQHYSGVLATKIQPSSSPFYWPLTGTQSPELPRDGRGINMTVNG